MGLLAPPIYDACSEEYLSQFENHLKSLQMLNLEKGDFNCWVYIVAMV